jgi:DNA-binding NarL/FixJ family response regulator
MSDLQGVSANTAPLLYADECRLSREAVALLLSTHRPDLRIEPIAGIDDVAGDGDAGLSRYQLVILHTHTVRVDDSRIAAQMARMSRCSPAIPFLLISDIEDPDVIIEAFRLGARGYITTAQSWAEAAEAIQFVASGGVAAPWKSLTALDRLDGANSIRTAGHQPAVRLTSRQLEVLKGLQQGKPNKVIAFELSMSESTVKVHIRQIMEKLHATNRTQVALIAREMLRA